MVSGRFSVTSIASNREHKKREAVANTRQIAEARRDRLVKRYEDLVVSSKVCPSN